MKQKKTGKCRRCQAFRELYRGDSWIKSPRKRYYCMDREAFTDREGGCEDWRPKKMEFDLSLARFEEAERTLRLLLRTFGRGSEE